MERDRARELRTGGGCLLVIAALFAAAFAATLIRLHNGADAVHPVLWPIWKAFGEPGLWAFGVVVVLLCAGLGAFSIRRARM